MSRALVPVVMMGRVTPAAGTDLSSWHGLQGPEQHNSDSLAALCFSVASKFRKGKLNLKEF